jgi:hypothetical protein
MEDPINERIFWSQIFPRLIPVRVEGAGKHGELELNVKYTAEELQAELLKRGLPLLQYGYDSPPLLELIEAPGACVTENAAVTNGVQTEEPHE